MPAIIAHRGACGYLPEHTLEAKALAYGQGADFLEQDVVATRDDQLIVLHDIHLETVTNVARRFPDRCRDDGRYYVRDFDLGELRTLNVHERRLADGETPAFPGRFPTNTGRFSIVSLDDELAMIAGLNKASGRRTGIYPEVKSPAWHRGEGVDVSRLLLETLASYGYHSRTDPVYVQCFDAAETARIRHELGSDLPLVQLIADNSWQESATDYDQLLTAEGLQHIATFADGIGPWLPQLYRGAEIDGHPVSTGVVSAAQAAGLLVHPYTFRADALAEGFATFEEQVLWFVSSLKIDGLFSDFPDKVAAVLNSL